LQRDDGIAGVPGHSHALPQLRTGVEIVGALEDCAVGAAEGVPDNADPGSKDLGGTEYPLRERDKLYSVAEGLKGDPPLFF